MVGQNDCSSILNVNADVDINVNTNINNSVNAIGEICGSAKNPYIYNSISHGEITVSGNGWQVVGGIVGHLFKGISEEGIGIYNCISDTVIINNNENNYYLNEETKSN